MQTYIALLRGINVSGQKKIKMADLRAQMEAIGFHNVRTYIQSGNILFELEETDYRELEQRIHQKIIEEYGFTVPVMVKTPAEFQAVVDHNPFPEDKGFDLKRLYVTFLDEEPDPERVATVREVDYSPEQFEIIGKDLYFYSPSGYGRAKMNNNFFEKKLKVAATTRNWRTVNVLLSM